MFHPLYTTLFILSAIMLFILVAIFRGRISVYYVLLFSCVLITNLGYMQLSGAEDLPMALFANQVVYLGAAFAPFFLLMCLADICKTRIPKWAQIGCVLFGCLIFFLISTTGIFPWYYRSVSFGYENGAGYIVKEYGPLHILYPIYLFSVVLVGLWFILRAFRRRMDVSYITSTLLLILMLIMVIVYSGEKALHLKVEILPIAYVICQAGLLVLLGRISLYDVTAISADSMVESQAYGFFLCDSRGKYLGGDVAAKLWFPELQALPLDVAVDFERTEFLRQIGKWIRQEDDRKSVYFTRDGCIVEATHTILRERKNKAIHCVYLRDDTRQQEYTRLVERYNQDLERDVNKKTEKIRQIQNDILISMASIVENRDSNTGGHIARTSDVVKIFVAYLLEQGQFSQLTPEIAQRVTKAAPLHDFGKIAIPDAVLNKPGKFTEEEYACMKLHPGKGAVIVERILQSSEDTLFKTIAIHVAHYHHEKWDGNGYPDGLKGTEIPFEARIMALADVFDALVSKRVYKDSYSYDKAFSILRQSAGTHFDPALCQAFLKCREQIEALYNAYGDCEKNVSSCI